MTIRDVLAAVVRHAPPEVLEAVARRPRVLRALFGALTRRFDPVAAAGETGDVVFELARRDGVTQRWTVAIGRDSAVARPGGSPDASLTVRTGVLDLLLLAAGELDAGRAVLDRRVDVVGDFGLAARLGAMFRMGSLF